MAADRILIVDDDQGAFLFARDVLETIRPGCYELEWANSYGRGLDALLTGTWDLCLLDHGLGTRSGLELLREATALRVKTPIVMLTGHKSTEMDLQAMEAGAADFLVKGDISAALLERTVRYAIAQNRAIDALRRSEERFSRAFRMAPLGITLTSLATGRILDVNERFCEMSGFSADEMIGRTSAELGLWASHDEQSAVLDTLRHSGRLDGYVLKLRTRSWQERHIEMYAELIELNGERCVLALLHDVTNRAALEEQLRQAQKMEAVGRLAGGVAHDFNNVLTSILGNVEFLLQDLPERSQQRSDVESIRQGAQRARDLTRQLLAFSRKQVLQPRRLDFAQTIAGFRELLRRLLGEDVELEIDAQGDAGCIEADAGQLEQVVVNLAVNARDAMPAGGRLALHMRHVHIDETHVAQFGEQPAPGPYALLEMRDTGTGMSEHVKSHLFEPFFTTKGEGVGTGLGLATVYGIIEQSGGFLEVESAPDRGTTFRVYLPQVARDIESGERTDRETGGTETILVVEDEATVRSLVRRILVNRGYRVLEAGSPLEALSRVLPVHGEEIDLMITDVVMPNMGGRELAERVLALHPDIDVIYMSGYTDDEIMRRGIVRLERHFLEKPFTPEQLSHLVRDVLDGVA